MNNKHICPDLITTIPYAGEIFLEHEELLLKCSREGNIKALIELSKSMTDEEDYEFEVTNTKPTKRISVLER